jgi:putative hydrolase of the HAD superfamily
MIKGVFFDLYGTLIITGENTASSWMAEFYTCLKRYGLSMSIDDFASRCYGFFSKEAPQQKKDGLTVYERRIKALCSELGIEIDTNGIRQTAASTVESANKNCSLDPDCHTILKTLLKHKTLALISNYDHSPYIKTMLKQMDIGKYFSTIIISEEVGLKKPAPGIFHLALQRTGLKPEEVIFVGDSVIDDIGGAASAGITPILLQREALAEGGLSAVFRDDYQTPQLQSVFQLPAGTRTIRRLTELIDIFG